MDSTHPTDAGQMLEIHSQDIIRLVEQFLKENNLHRTLKALQEETQVPLNTVDNVDAFTKDIINGRWNAVLKATRALALPQRKVMDLYEHIIMELIEGGEKSAARILLRQTDPMQVLRDQFSDRYLHLESILAVQEFYPRMAYGEEPKESRRERLARSLASELQVVPPSRLLTLLGQALRWQLERECLSVETGYDLFRGATPELRDVDDSPVSHCYATIQFPDKQHAESAAFSPNGQMLATGSSDGFIEIWNPVTGKLRKDLSYQANDRMMGMEAGVLCLAFAKDSLSLSSGAQDGKIKVWKVATGQCLRRFVDAHAQGVTAVAFNKDATQVFSGGFDGIIRVHGMKSGKMLREFRGHTSFINAITFSADHMRMFSGSSDGTVRIWETKSGDCAKTVSPVGPTGVTALLPMSVGGHILVGSQGKSIVTIDTRGKTAWEVALDKELPKDLLGFATSPKGEYIYAIAEDGRLGTVAFRSKAVTTLVTIDKVIGMTAHPFANVIAIWNENGQIALWNA